MIVIVEDSFIFVACFVSITQVYAMKSPWLFLSFIVCILISLPRWDKSDIGFIKDHSYYKDSTVKYSAGAALSDFSDDMAYTQIVEYYRTGKVDERVGPPYTYRPFVLFTASLLPFRAISSINIVNLTFSLLTLYFLYLILIHYGSTPKFAAIATFLYSFSFNTFYYNSIGLIDPVVAGFFAMIFYFLLKEKYLLVFILYIFATLTKEASILLLPVIFTSVAVNKKSYFDGLMYSGFAFLLFVLFQYIARNIAVGQANYLWGFSLESLLFNITRKRAWQSSILTTGVSGLLAIIYIIKNLKFNKELLFSPLLPLYSGVGIFIIFIIYGFISIRIGGSYYLILIVFSLPLAVEYLKTTKIYAKLR